MMDNWTPLPAKWTPSSLCKYNDTLWQRFLKATLNNERLTKEQKNHIINYNLEWIRLIHNYTMSGQMTYKKEANKE